MSDDEASLVSLAIYLAKAGLEKPADVIQNLEELNSFDIADDDGSLGTLYVESRKSKPPKWGEFFLPQVKLTDLGRVSSTAAILSATVEKRVFLIAFGQGRHLMQPVCHEEQFGLKVTLNAIGENRFRSIDKHTLDTIGRHTRVQVSKEAAPSDFGLDIERDLLRAVTGTPDDKALGKTLSGLDSLHILARVTVKSLRELLSKYLTLFGQETYKTKFPWINQIADVKDPVLKERLDGLMLASILKSRFDKCWLAVPEPIDWAEVAGFRYGKGKKRATVHEIDFGSFLKDGEIDPGDLTIEFLTRHDVSAIDGEGTEKYGWSVYRCIYCEVEDSGATYILSGGRWYGVAPDFVTEVNEFYQRIPRYDVALPEYDDSSEEAYNDRVAQAAKHTYALMDRQLIPIGGGYSKIEFCDLFSRANDVIHVKRYGGSGVLSHLFAQGVISGQLFMSSDAFRKAVNGLLPRSHKLTDSRAQPDARAYRIVFAIVSSESGKDISLPFFSRLNARQAVQTLGGYGYKVAVAKIGMNEAKAKTRKFPARRAKKLAKVR